jgi:hypothetical protein
MTVSYRRTRSSRGDSVAAAAVSVAIGAVAAAVAFYLARLFLSREPLVAGTAVAAGDPPSHEAALSRDEESGGVPTR